MTRNKHLFFIMLLIVGTIISGSSLKAQQVEPSLRFITPEAKKIFREELINNLIVKYREKQVFNNIQQYMVEKAEELHRVKRLRLPDILIQDTFNKTNNLFEHTKGIIGNSFSTSFEPEQFEKNVRKYLWLKGLGFWVMGIGEDHKLAFSYFYLPGNENLKNDLLREIVQYSFPEVPQCEENTEWYSEMIQIMGRLGYNIFSVKKYGIEAGL